MNQGKPFRVGRAVMVSSTSEDTESADGMRGWIECNFPGDACVIRMRLGELVLLDSIAA